MYVLSANSQDMHGDGIYSLCLEEPFRNAPSAVCHLEASFAFWGKTRPDVQGSERQTCRSFQGFPHSIMGIHPYQEPKIKPESSVVLNIREGIQIKVRVLLIYYPKSYAEAFQIFLPFK